MSRRLPHPPRRRLARRLLAAQVLVIVAGGVTLAVVAALVSPPLFRSHVRRAVGPVSDPVARHLDQAFSDALLIALGIAAVAAVAAALAVSWILSSRIARPIEDLSRAAADIEAGNLGSRAPRPPADDELADLSVAFNQMAATLEETEDTRRRLLSDLAHELRTPLATIEGYLEGLADGVVDPAPATWATLQAAAERLRRLVDDVALVSRAEEGRLDLEVETVAVGVLLEDAVSAHATAFEAAGTELQAQVDPDLPPVTVDPHRMAQVLDNLLLNARRHTGSGDRVTVRASGRGDEVAVTVADTGAGIDADDLPRVFERFYRGDASRHHEHGSGIGLTIARAIARAHGGDLTAASDGPGRGAAFTVTLPAARPPAGRERPGR